MNFKEHFVNIDCLLSPKQDFPETALQGDILHHLDGSYYVYVGSKWIPLKEAMNIIYEV